MRLWPAQRTTLPWPSSHTFRIGGKNKSLIQCLCCNVLARRVQCETPIWSLFFMGHAVLFSFLWSILPQCAVITDENASWVAMRRDCIVTPPHAIGLLQSSAANEETLSPVNFFLSVTCSAPSMSMHNLSVCELWTFKEVHWILQRTMTCRKVCCEAFSIYTRAMLACSKTLPYHS